MQRQCFQDETADMDIQEDDIFIAMTCRHQAEKDNVEERERWGLASRQTLMHCFA